MGVGILEGLDLSFPDNTSPYPIEWPDVLQTDREPMAYYADGRIAGTLDEQVAFLGYPFEAIGSQEARSIAMAAILTTLAPDYTPPEVEEETDTGDPNAETPKGGCACASVQMSWPGFGLLALAIGVVTRRRVSV